MKFDSLLLVTLLLPM